MKAIFTSLLLLASITSTLNANIDQDNLPPETASYIIQGYRLELSFLAHNGLTQAEIASVEDQIKQIIEKFNGAQRAINSEFDSTWSETRKEEEYNKYQFRIKVSNFTFLPFAIGLATTTVGIPALVLKRSLGAKILAFSALLMGAGIAGKIIHDPYLDKAERSYNDLIKRKYGKHLDDLARRNKVLQETRPARFKVCVHESKENPQDRRIIVHNISASSWD